MNKSEPNIFPFTTAQLKKFKKELQKAGSFHALMIQKHALEDKQGRKYITHYHDLQKYKRTFLIGVYKPLRPMYDTDVPFNFWDEMNDALIEMEGKDI